MWERSDSNFPDPSVGDSVRVQVPSVDRNKTDARSVIACVMEKTDDNFYRLGTRTGVLKAMYVRSQFSLCHGKFIDISDVPVASTSLRTATSLQALSEG